MTSESGLWAVWGSTCDGREHILIGVYSDSALATKAAHYWLNTVWPGWDVYTGSRGLSRYFTHPESRVGRPWPARISPLELNELTDRAKFILDSASNL